MSLFEQGLCSCCRARPFLSACSQTWSGCPSPASSVRGSQTMPVGRAMALVSSPSLPCPVSCRGLVLCMRKGLFPGNSPRRRAAGPVWEDGVHEGSQDPAVGKSSRAFPKVLRSPQAGRHLEFLALLADDGGLGRLQGRRVFRHAQAQLLVVVPVLGQFLQWEPRGVTSLAPVRPCLAPHTLSSLPGAAGGCPLASCPHKS